MRPNSDQLMCLAEAFACITLAAMCVYAALNGDHTPAWGLGIASLSFAWDVKRRLDRYRRKPCPATPEGDTSPGE
ncbi:hypothetical protein [Streptomyces sp. NPDC005435]|uniref:hypothetical protein n=1 Tax=Streptomyces sp. NPDC005435 TaxID=3154464 RepID=UPI003451138A